MLHPAFPRPFAGLVALATTLGVISAAAFAGPVAAHDAPAGAPSSLTAVEERNQLALQAVLAGNTPADTEHAAEHDGLRSAVEAFDRLPAERKAAIRRGGASALTADGDPAVVGAWATAPFPAPTYATNMVLLPTGKVLLFSMGATHGNCQERCTDGFLGNGGFNVNNDGAAAVWDPTKGTGPAAFRILPPPNVDLTGYDLTAVRADPVVIAGNADNPALDTGVDALRPAPIFCSGQVQTADGRVLIAGGNLEARGKAYGLRLSFLFDPVTERWTREPDLKFARWYPTLTRLPSGRIAILGGRDERGEEVASIELYPEQATPVPGAAGPAGSTGHVTSSVFDDPLDPANPLGIKDGGGGTTYSEAMGYYPHTMLLPDGRLAASRWQSGRLGLLSPDGDAFSYLPATGYKSALGKYATAFPVPGDEHGTDELVMVGGVGIDPSTFGPSDVLLDATWAIKPAEAAVGLTDWTPQPPLHIARRNAIATLLPDGSATVIGGGGIPDRIPFAAIADPQPQRQVELWDPVSRNWTLGPAQPTARGYHSSAVLLPDGRVLSGGDDWTSYVLDTDLTDAYDTTLELYSPPYMFKGARPVVETVPERIDFGGTFTVYGQAGEGHEITRATLVAPGASTHAFDSNQRVLELPLQALGTGTFAVTAPVSGNAAPPGDYLLFLLDERGVPSVGEFVRVASTHPSVVEEDEDEDPAPPTPVPSGDAGSSPPAASQPTPTTLPAATDVIAPPGTAAKTPSSVRTYEVGLRDRKLTIAALLVPTGKRCPARVTATTRVGAVTISKRVRVRAITIASKRRCQATGTITLGTAPAAGSRVRVRLSGAQLRSRSLLAVRLSS